MTPVAPADGMTIVRRGPTGLLSVPAGNPKSFIRARRLRAGDNAQVRPNGIQVGCSRATVVMRVSALKAVEHGVLLTCDGSQPALRAAVSCRFRQVPMKPSSTARWSDRLTIR